MCYARRCFAYYSPILSHNIIANYKPQHIIHSDHPEKVIFIIGSFECSSGFQASTCCTQLELIIIIVNTQTNIFSVIQCLYTYANNSNYNIVNKNSYS